MMKCEVASCNFFIVEDFARLLQCEELPSITLGRSPVHRCRAVINDVDSGADLQQIVDDLQALWFKQGQQA